MAIENDGTCRVQCPHKICPMRCPSSVEALGESFCFLKVKNVFVSVTPPHYQNHDLAHGISLRFYAVGDHRSSLGFQSILCAKFEIWISDSLACQDIASSIQKVPKALIPYTIPLF